MNLEPPVSLQAQNILYNDRNCFSALNTISMIIFSYFLRMFLCLLLKSCYLLKKKKFLRKWKNYTMNGLFFNNFWMIGIEGYFELYINGYMNIMTGSTDSLGEVLGFGFAIFYLALIFLIMILIFWISIFKSFDKLNSKKFK